MTEGTTTIELTDIVDPAVAAALSAGLDEYNTERSGVADRRPLALVVRDPATRRVIGGLTGRTSLGLLFVDQLYLPAELRGSGLGSELLRRAEAEGRTRGCRTGFLYTISFAAPGFYQRNGWRVFGEVPCDPPGTSRVFLTKDL
jgi:GNAT superfamily N-acetyltransferase